MLTREPFAPLFRINAPEAKPAGFTPDSQDITLYNSDLRIEIWSVADQKLKTAHELFTRKKTCFQTALSPDAKSLACLDEEFSLNLFDVASGGQTFQKKNFYTPDLFGVLMRLLARFDSDEKRDEFTFSNAVEFARFSADGKALFVLSANQTVYLLDVSALSRK